LISQSGAERDCAERIFAIAKRVWGTEQDAIKWLNTPHAELHGVSPASLLGSWAGRKRVEELLTALEFGFPV
jgi:putative toxin-antitoxin system antitoxin component (TIGR02293 family)